MPQRHRFGRFELRPVERSLLVDGQAASLGARAFDLLLALVERRDRLVLKEELLQLVWPGLVVGENNLHTQISTLRGLLGPPAIATIAGRGYRFTMKVGDESVADGSEPSPSVAVAVNSVNAPALGDAQSSSQAPALIPDGRRPSTRKLAAILSSDVVGYSRLMGEDDQATLEAIVATRNVMATHIARHGGRVVDASGDALLGEFTSAVESVRCAIAIQAEMAQRNSPVPESRRMVLRIGLNLGDVIEQDAALYGEAVNDAVRLQALGEPGGVCISGSIFDQVDGKLPLGFRFAADQAVENVAVPVRAYHVGVQFQAAVPRATELPGHSNSMQYRFGRYELRPDERVLLVDAEPAKLGARAFDVLLTLIQLRERVVSKNELLDLVWPGVVVEENNLQTQVSTLRKLLGPQAVQTIPGRGYRFVAALDGVRLESKPQPAPAPVALGTAKTSTGSASTPFKTNLPEVLPPLFGRDDDVAALGALIAQHRLISIIAAGGMGKTRLALQLLHERRQAFEHGVCWVEMAGLSDPQLVASTVASALGIQTGSGDALKGLLASLKGMTLLIALDNAEHLIEEVARVVQVLIDGAPQLRLLVTSQVPLKCTKERVYRLGSLAVPDVPVPVDEALTFGAVALFEDSAYAADRRFALTPDNVATVIEICRHLDGMALAIELAAARVLLLGVTKLAATLNQRLRVLTGGNRTAPQRHKTLRAALEWSHALLDTAEQAVFRRLGVFAGGFELGMAQQVVADQTSEPALDEWAVLDVLGALVDRSLVMVDAGEQPRYRLLESPRAFALERLAAAGEEAAWRRRHAQAVLVHFVEADAGCWAGRSRVDAAIAVLEHDLDNGRDAMTWALANDAQLAVALAPSLAFALTWNRLGEQVTVWEATSKLVTNELPDSLRAAWALACSRSCGFFKGESASKWAHVAIDLYRAMGMPIELYESLAAGCWFGYSDNPDWLDQALREMRELEVPGWPAWVKYFGARAQVWGCTVCSDFDGAMAALDRQICFAESAGTLNGLLGAMGDRADIALSAGRVDEAVQIGLGLERQLAATRERSILAVVRTNLTGALLAQGSLDQARAMALAAWPLAQQFERRDWLADNLALLAAHEGRARSAARLLGFGDAAYAANGHVRQINERRAAEQAERITREAIDADEFERLKADGAGLTDDEIAWHAFVMKED